LTFIVTSAARRAPIPASVAVPPMHPTPARPTPAPVPPRAAATAAGTAAALTPTPAARRPARAIAYRTWNCAKAAASEARRHVNLPRRHIAFDDD
jgi:hypothetical protein